VRSRLSMTTILAAAAVAIWSGTPVRVNVKRVLSFRCWFFGHDDWVRRASGRLYLECFECGRETSGWSTDRNHRNDQIAPDVTAAAVADDMTVAA
jgi:hypothetical protein